MEFDVKRIRSKPADAVQFDFDHIEEIVHWTGATNYAILNEEDHPVRLILQHPDWSISLFKGDWVIQSEQGEVFKAADGPFRDTFDILEDRPATREEETALFEMMNSVGIETVEDDE